jgi:2-polyprenyl-3-methyl-5-hydroxy-6-metoxy-1,4-benzoquinol methylase
MSNKEIQDSESTAFCICQKNCPIYFTIRGFKIYRCQNCSLIFVNPREDIVQIYNQDYFYGATHGYGFVNYEEDKIASKGYLIKYLRWFKRLGFTKGAKLLDVGAANGFFVSLAESFGYEAVGVELSKEAVHWAQQLNRAVIESNALEISLEDKYDIITVLDVLEHLPNPEDFLVKIKKNLNDSGILVLNVPNSGSLFAKLCGRSWHSYIPPEHLFYFNRKSLTHALTSNGYKILKVRSISKTFKAEYIFKTIVNSPQIPTFLRKMISLLDPIFKSRFGRIKIYLPLFDNLTVIAKQLNQIECL